MSDGHSVLKGDPSDRKADVVLRNGSTVQVRPVRPEDEVALLQFFNSLSPESRKLRFFSSGVDLPAEAVRESHVDYRNAYGLVAVAGADQRIVGHASYFGIAEHRAEVSFTIADAYQAVGWGRSCWGT